MKKQSLVPWWFVIAVTVIGGFTIRGCTAELAEVKAQRLTAFRLVSVVWNEIEQWPYYERQGCIKIDSLNILIRFEWQVDQIAPSGDSSVLWVVIKR